MNVATAWQKGYTGKGVVVSILDDGIQTNHPDLAQNYVSRIRLLVQAMLQLSCNFAFMHYLKSLTVKRNKNISNDHIHTL